MRAEKKFIVDELINEIRSANPLIFTDYSKVRANDANRLRIQLKAVNSNYRVVQNTLFLKALESLGIREKYEPHISGPTAIAYGGKDVVEVIKALIKFTKDSQDMLVIKGGVVDNQYFETKGLEELSKLPAKEVLLARLVGQINVPLSRFAMVLNGSLQKLVCVMNAIAKKKEEEQNPKQ
jgi:large subunit ribosomal protein L10